MVYCYSGRAEEDEVTERLRTAADVWRPTMGTTDAELAEQIRQDGIDILVDLAGHTGASRLPVFTGKPAPVQVSWLGYWGTTGLDTIDYVLTDEITVPAGQEQYFVEKVVRLPDTRLCFAPRNYAPQVAPLPALGRGHVTFGCFNNLAKITPGVVALWAELLRVVPETRLILKWKSFENRATRERYLDLFDKNGINSERVDLRGGSDHLALLREYGDMDIALDPFPFSGGLTSCEALWMGVPVVTLPGDLPISRQTACFLTNLGLGELVAGSQDEYVRIVSSLARDPERLEQLRRELRPRMKASPLCDNRRFTLNLEHAFREMWRTWCGKQEAVSGLRERSRF